MTGKIEILKPNLFIAQGVYHHTVHAASEVYFCLGDAEQLSKACAHVDNLTTEKIGELRIGKTSNLISKGRFFSEAYHIKMLENNFRIPLKEYIHGDFSTLFLLSLPDAPDAEKDADHPRKDAQPREKLPYKEFRVFWDPKTDPMEFFYAKTGGFNSSSDKGIWFDRCEETLRELGKYAENEQLALKMEEIIIKLGELEKVYKEMSDNETIAAFHVIRCTAPQVPFREKKLFPIGRVSVYNYKSDGEKILRAFADGLTEFDGPELSVDKVPEYMHLLKNIEHTIDNISSLSGGSVRVKKLEELRKGLFKS